MTEAASEWRATIRVRTSNPRVSDWLERSLSPEVAREVPRARASLRKSAPGRVDVVIEARDAGAVRAALNTYLGWIHLSLATVRRAGYATDDDPSRRG